MVRALVCATGMAVALGACSAPPPPPSPTPSSQVSEQPGRSATSDRRAQAEADEAGSCTEVGNAEGVGVDLTGVLDLESGDYLVEVSVPAQGASAVRGFAGDAEPHPGGGVLVDLDGEPVTVEVVVRDQDGQEVHAAPGAAAPGLNQPNGARCDGENYYLSLRATTSTDLVPVSLS